MTYDQWKTTDMSQEGRVCDCGSGEWAYVIYDGIYPHWTCKACDEDTLLDELDATLARVDAALNEEDDG